MTKNYLFWTESVQPLNFNFEAFDRFVVGQGKKSEIGRFGEASVPYGFKENWAMLYRVHALSSKAYARSNL